MVPPARGAWGRLPLEPRHPAVGLPVRAFVTDVGKTLVAGPRFELSDQEPGWQHPQGMPKLTACASRLTSPAQATRFCRISICKKKKNALILHLDASDENLQSGRGHQGCSEGSRRERWRGVSSLFANAPSPVQRVNRALVLCAPPNRSIITPHARNVNPHGASVTFKYSFATFVTFAPHRRFERLVALRT